MFWEFLFMFLVLIIFLMWFKFVDFFILFISDFIWIIVFFWRIIFLSFFGVEVVFSDSDIVFVFIFFV